MIKKAHGSHFIVVYSSAAAIAILIGITSILYFNDRNLAPVIAQSEQSQQSPLSQNPETPKATWVQANQSVVPLYNSQREINGSRINNGEITFPQESNYPHKPEPDAELLQNKIIVPKGSEYAIVLADGTKVKMNADSHINFPVQFGDTREVTLEGEAMFEVTHDEARPFIIKTHDHTIYVLGTTFNISAYPDEELSVTLIEGKLKVNAPSGEYYLLPGEHYSSAQ